MAIYLFSSHFGYKWPKHSNVCTLFSRDCKHYWVFFSSCLHCFTFTLILFVSWTEFFFREILSLNTIWNSCVFRHHRFYQNSLIVFTPYIILLVTCTEKKNGEGLCPFVVMYYWVLSDFRWFSLLVMHTRDNLFSTSLLWTTSRQNRPKCDNSLQRMYNKDTKVFSNFLLCVDINPNGWRNNGAYELNRYRSFSFHLDKHAVWCLLIRWFFRVERARNSRQH